MNIAITVKSLVWVDKGTVLKSTDCMEDVLTIKHGASVAAVKS